MAEQEQVAANELVTAPESQVGALALISMDPAKYVAEVYQPFRDRFNALKGETDLIVFSLAQLNDLPEDVRADAVVCDITTTAGMGVAVKYRAAYRDDVRLAGEKARVDRKAPFLKVGQLLDSQYKALATDAAPHETRFDKAIQDEVERKAAEKEEKRLANEARVAAIRAKIDAIRSRPMQLSGKGSEEIKVVAIEFAQLAVTAEDFAELTEEALRVLNEAGLELEGMYNGALAREQAEAEAARLLAEEQARVAAQAEANRLEAERLEKLRKEAAEVEAERQRVIAKEEAERQRVARETKAQLEAQAAELDKKRKEQEQADAERKASLDADRKALADVKAIQAVGAAVIWNPGDLVAAIAMVKSMPAAAGPMGEMLETAREMALFGLSLKLAAAVEADHEEAISMNIAFDMMLPPAKFPYPPDYTAAAAPLLPAVISAPSTVDSSPIVAEKLPCGDLCDLAEVVVLDTRPTDQEIIAMVADYYHLTTLETIDRLAQIDFVAARAREQAAA